MTEKDDTKEALERLAAARDAYKASETAHERAREQALIAVVAALKAGATPGAVTAAGPFTDAYVRKIARDNDIGPAKRGVKSKGGSTLRVELPE
jgi:hypothetical protein